MRKLTLLQPPKVVLGEGAVLSALDDLCERGARRALVVTSPPVRSLLEAWLQQARERRLQTTLYAEVRQEPTVAMLQEGIELAREVGASAVVGVGGGSVLDLAKGIAALAQSEQSFAEVAGIGRLRERKLLLLCVPTTAGTGSEVSPNALFLAEGEPGKQAIISPHLVPDAAFLDPQLTTTLPPDLTAATGLDALAHAIEAYANRNHHPAVDHYALQSVRLIGQNLLRAVHCGSDLEARANMLLASMFAGLCLGPVNTGACHALAYPLGAEFHIPHGLSISVLLPHVVEFNIEAMPDRYAEIAKALGVEAAETPTATAQRGVLKLRELIAAAGIPTKLSELGVSEEAIPGMARSALLVTRLLRNNPREIDLPQAEAIYRSAY